MFGRRKIEEEIRARLDPNHIPPPKRDWAVTAYFVGGIIWLAQTGAWAVLMIFRIIQGDDYFHQFLACLLCSLLSAQAFNQATTYIKLDTIRMLVNRR